MEGEQGPFVDYANGLDVIQCRWCHVRVMNTLDKVSRISVGMTQFNQLNRVHPRAPALPAHNLFHTVACQFSKLVAIHAFVWYGKTSERAVEVAGLTPAGDTAAYVLGHLTWVPSETTASYGDLDPQYLLASYRVYLNEPDAKRVFAYIKKLQANSPVWNAETSNCTSFIGDIAEFMGLKVPHRWQRPENYVNSLKEMNGGRQMVQLSAVQ